MYVHSEDDLQKMVEGKFTGTIDFDDLYELLGDMDTSSVFGYLLETIGNFNDPQGTNA